jgi:glucose-1-phosphate thymidylyltransferase
MTKLIGIIPAAGQGSRLFPYNGGKELLPVGSQILEINGRQENRPKIISQYAIEAMIEAGVEHIIIVTHPTKHGLMGLHLDGSQYGTHISYIVQHPGSMAHSIDLAYHWVKDATVIMAMPDTIIAPSNCIKQLLDSHQKDQAVLSLGLFPAERPHKAGMIKTDTENNVIYHKDKPAETDATMMWGVTAWGPAFTKLLHKYLQQQPEGDKEIALGDVFDVCLAQGKACKAYSIAGGKYYDIGTYDDYRRAIQEL